ncbi:MAG: 16S rRNA (guanine(966)-N(2))-methyltransferase RsmD [Candidatus Dormibacterales bacterium]
MSGLRVGSGEACGRRLLAPAGIRPTEALVKAAIFNMLGDAVLDVRVLDVFAGSGSLGIEALSRGAAFATFVERSRACASILGQNLDALRLRTRSRLAVADARRWLEANPEEVRAAAVIILDPPYEGGAVTPVLEILEGSAAPGTLVVAEHAAGLQPGGRGRLVAVRERRYGGSAVTVLRAA